MGGYWRNPIPRARPCRGRLGQRWHGSGIDSCGKQDQQQEKQGDNQNVDDHEGFLPAARELGHKASIAPEGAMQF